MVLQAQSLTITKAIRYRWKFRRQSLDAGAKYKTRVKKRPPKAMGDGAIDDELAHTIVGGHQVIREVAFAIAFELGQVVSALSNGKRIYRGVYLDEVECLLHVAHTTSRSNLVGSVLVDLNVDAPRRGVD